MDPSFRRYVLVQLLLIFQYLTSSTKFKTSDQILSEEQLEWINRKRKQMLQLLAGDSTTGRLNSGFVSVIQSILDRETHWNRWKNDGCPSFTYNVEKSQFSPRKRRVNPLVNRAGQKIYRFGNRELDKLWNVCPDNLEACRDQRRVFNPDLKTYFQDAILELDPEEKVEEEYKSINKDEWSWRALRLLARRCPHFYINWNPPGRPIKDYLTIILREKIQLDDESKLMNNPNSTTKEHFPSKQPRMDGVLNPSSFDLAPPTTKLSERSKMEHVSDGNHSSITRTRSRVSGAGVGASSKSCHHENGTLDFESNGELESHAAIDDEMQDAL